MPAADRGAPALTAELGRTLVPLVTLPGDIVPGNQTPADRLPADLVPAQAGPV